MIDEQPTPRPWFRDGRVIYTKDAAGQNCNILGIDKDNTIIVFEEADAVLVMKAVHSYDAMVAALKQLPRAIDDADETRMGALQDALDECHQALELAVKDYPETPLE